MCMAIYTEVKSALLSNSSLFCVLCLLTFHYLFIYSFGFSLQIQDWFLILHRVSVVCFHYGITYKACSRCLYWIATFLIKFKHRILSFHHYLLNSCRVAISIGFFLILGYSRKEEDDGDL